MSDSFPNSLMSGHLNENGLTHATHLSFCQQTSQNDKMLFDHHPFAGYPEPNRHCVIDQLNINQGIRNISFWGGAKSRRGNIFWCWFIENPTFGFIKASIKSLVPVWKDSRIKDLHDIVWRPWPWACLDLVIILTMA